MNQCIRYTLLCAVLTGVLSGRAQTYFLNGDAIFLGEDCYQLTTTLNYQNGTVWYGDQIDLSLPFDIQFRMNLGTNDGSGADGICFVLQTVGTTAIGQSGGGLGYLDFGTSLGIEFDTWQNGNYNDPGYDHIAIERDGDIDHNSPNNIAGPIQMDPFDQNTEDGADHVVQINWDPSAQTIRVYFDCNFRLEGNIDLINSIFGGENLVYWGFTAATGGAVNNQTVCLQENILSVGDEVTICPGASTVLSAGSSLNGVYSWLPADYLDDPSSATPTATPPLPITYNVTFTDLCGNNVDAEIFVNVEELDVTLLADGIVTCSNNDVTITSSSNFTGIQYEWSTTEGNFLSSQTLGNVVVDSPGTYTLNAIALDICVDTESVTVMADLTPPSPNAGEDQVLNCSNPVITLNATAGTSDPAIIWTSPDGSVLSGVNSLSPTIEEPGNYTLNVTDLSNGCSGSDLLVITENITPPIVSAPLQDTLSCVLPEITFNGISAEGTGELSFAWSTDGGFIVSGALSPAPVVNAPGIYDLVVTDSANGCQANTEVEVVTSDNVNIDLSTLTFPNIISPNGDEMNQIWKPFLSADPTLDLQPFFSTYELVVYNRWGSKLFESTPTSFAWKAEDAESGVYFYHLRFATLCGGGLEDSLEGYIHVVK